ncbi:MAG: hypothetical protein IH991_18695 [Planctomycetes bacterium]|nr:hypothetical protein [Planctomycetota bacterium]
MSEAQAAGAMMLFGEKYGDQVRLVSMGDFSRELCAGTHLENTREVGPLEIISEESVSAGVRRIVALTGTKAQDFMRRTTYLLTDAAQRLGVHDLDVPAAVRQLTQTVRDLKKYLSSGTKAPDQPTKDTIESSGPAALPTFPEKKASLREAAKVLNVSMFDVVDRVKSLLDEAVKLKKQLEEVADRGQLSADTLLEQSMDIGGVKIVVAETPGANPNLMRQLIDQLRKKTGSTAVLLASAQGNDKVVLVAGITNDLIERGISAGSWVKKVAPVVGGGGGGKPDMAQAGGKQPEKIGDAIELAKSIIISQLESD